MVLEDTERNELKEILHNFIDTKCIFRCNPDIQYCSGIPRGTIPSSSPGSYNKWQVYLRNLSHDSDMVTAACMLIIDQMESNGDQFHAIQLCGMETSSLPLIASLQANIRRFKTVSVNSYSVRKERKKYGLFNFFDGIPSRKPFVMVDDVVNSGSSSERLLDSSLYEYDLDPHHNAYFIISLNPKTKYKLWNGTNIKLNWLFDKDDFKIDYDPKKYWLPEDSLKTINYRPDYR
tara:strand:- start:3003 stop:3701 length:699 start_codon:yes stop_codon:yes gene_type:complete